MRTCLRLALVFLIATIASAHPGAAIAVSKDGVVYFVDTGGGVFSVDPSGRVRRHDGPAFHWFAFDPAQRFQKTPFPSIPGAEVRAAGVVVLSSDFPVVIGNNGTFYYPDGRSGDRIRLVGVDPSGARSTLTTLPLIRRGGETITWLNGLAATPDGSLYYTEDRAIRKVDRRGQVSTIVANVAVPNCKAVPGIGNDEGPYLRGLAVAGDGSIYVAASGCAALLKVNAKGQVSPLLRTSPPWSATAVAVSGRDVYVLEYLHTASDNRVEWIPRIRKISGAGAVTQLFVGRAVRASSSK